jgi:hypothetical protein
MRSPRNLVPWFFEGVYRREDLRRHLVAVRELEPRRDEAYEHAYLYDCLGVIDAKAQALLAYDAILMTGASIALTLLPGKVSAGTVLVVIALIVSGLSSALCLTVIWVHWTDTTEFDRAADSFTRLLTIRNRRTVNFRLSWLLAQAAALLLVVGIPLQR